MTCALEKSNAEHALALGELKSGFNEQMSALTQAIALMAKATGENKENETPRKRRRYKRYESSSDESSSEEEETPPRRRRAQFEKEKTRRRGKKSTGASFKEDEKYRPAMKFNYDWSQQDRRHFINARKKYHKTDTKAARADKLTMLEEVLERNKNHQNKESIVRQIEELKSKDE